tara:strand:- start:154 stop:504 length:351 start_codon:yes stop_codon:yes gene_type:complete
MNNNFDDIQKKIVAFRDARDWKQFHNPKDLALSLVLEATELLEHFQWKNEKQSLEHIKHKKTEIEDEIADVLYWILLIANDLDINLHQASINKLAKNDMKYEISKAKGTSKKYTEL